MNRKIPQYINSMADSEMPESFNKSKGDRNEAQSYSNTHYYKRNPKTNLMEKVKKKGAMEIKENLTGISSMSSETFNCELGNKERHYSEEDILEIFLRKQLDPVTIDDSWKNECPVTVDWEIARTLEFMVKDPIANQQHDRLQSHLQDFVRISAYGFKIDILDSLCVILEYLSENLSPKYKLRDEFTLLLHAMNKPILMNATSDVATYFASLQNYINFMGYLLMRLEEDVNFDLLSRALVWQMSAGSFKRQNSTVQVHHMVTAASGLCVTSVRMLALATVHRFPTFLEMAILLACNSVDNCKCMMKENVFECIFYRFNPYFPDRDLPAYDINPEDPQDINVKLGASSIHISTALNLMLVLLKTAKEILKDDPEFSSTLPCPDPYSIRCFAWAYRYECRARDHRHERIMLTIVAYCLLDCFGNRLSSLCDILMADILSLSVRTEVPLRHDWTGSVQFNTSHIDVYFKQVLLYLSVDFLKKFPRNRFMMESRHWLLGVMYLLDPALCKLRPRWSQPLYADLKKTAFKALVCTLPLASENILQNYDIIRRLMWYIEWYSINPFELPELYWCLRVLQVAVSRRRTYIRRIMMTDLFNTHGIIIIIRLCHTMLDQKSPPVEKGQVIISLCLKLITSAIEVNTKLNCSVYPEIKWPSSVYTLGTRMLDVVSNSLEKHLIISDKWLISLLNLIWEAIIWKDVFRKKFVIDNGVYKLLDLITLTRPWVQCLALALVCDTVRAGAAVGQLITWRASSAASEVFPSLVNRGATIANLLAAIFRDECREKEIYLDANGVIQNLQCPLMTPQPEPDMTKDFDCHYTAYRTLTCLPAADLTGSRMSKVYAILHMLSKDLAFKVSLADEAYNLYKHIKLPPQDEAVLVMASHYLTMKLNETWMETNLQCHNLLPQDSEVLEEFLQMAYGWAKEIKRMQEEVVEKSEKENYEVECSFYEFLSKVRLNVALDALREIRCSARSSDRLQITHSLLHDAVMAEKRRSELSEKLQTPVIKTYAAPLDDQYLRGQHLKVFSIQPKRV